MKREEKLEKIIAYIKEGEKKDRDFYIGFEAEHFVVDRDSLESECYYGDKGVLGA
ncbi:MAG: hypothetical protein SOU08_07860 [Anaerococcus sp.]|nr:hypothetical protein [Anaerococcus sp.]MDD7043847.1 hypothetical protein [Peptoniphilaceae bacterium]MDY2919533.1 hypothetical protein [Anaerococcus sp.]